MLSLLSGELAAGGNVREAIDHDLKALKITEAMVAASPTNAQARKDTAEVLADIASLHEKLGELDPALDFERRSLALREALVAEAPADDVRFRHGLAKAYREMGALYLARAGGAGSRGQQAVRSWREARTWYGRSLELWQELERRGVTAAKAERERVTQQLARVDASLAQSGPGRVE